MQTSLQAPASTSLMASDKPTRTNATGATQPNTTKPIQSCTETQLPASLPSPYRASSHTSLQMGPCICCKENDPITLQTSNTIPATRLQPPSNSMEMARHHTALTKEQRPEREAMKRWAQQERENAATCTSLGKSLPFLQREKDMDILRYYDYA
ncbi:hypothetical protein U0070_009510, partial [Myodes glareolus]